MLEEKLIGALKNGDTKALDRIVKSYSGYVLTVLRNFSHSSLPKEDIDELFTDVFFRLWNYREKLDTKFGLRPYLSAIARNAVKNRFRDCLPESHEDIDALSLSSDDDTERQAELGEMLNCLYETVSGLEKQEREMFLRYYFYGEKVSVIAKNAGMTEEAVRTGMSRIKKKIRQQLTERGYEHV